MSPVLPADFETAATEIITVGKFLAARGWAPATSGNYSMRLSGGQIAITVSGQEKGELTRDSVMLIDEEGKPLDHRAPSAEAVLHVGIYKACPECKAVLHTHSRDATVLAKRCPDISALPLRDYEFLKVYPGIKTHDITVKLPIYNNTQDMQKLNREIAPSLPGEIPAYLIRSHGLYGWGKTMAEARRIVEATEFMVSCELELRR